MFTRVFTTRVTSQIKPIVMSSSLRFFSGDASGPKNRLFIGGISWSTSEESLRTTFSAVGPLKDVRIIRDRETGRSKGFGFVTFENEADAISAMESLNEKELDGRKIFINQAKDNRPNRGTNRFNQGEGNQQ